MKKLILFLLLSFISMPCFAIEFSTPTVTICQAPMSEFRVTFNTLSGVNVIEENGIIGTAYNTPTFESGKFGDCVHLDRSSSEYVEFADNSAYDISGDFVLSVWLKLDVNNLTQMALECSDTGGDFIQIGFFGSAIQVSLQTGAAGTENIYVPTEAFPTGNWNHVVMTRIGTTFSYYRNAILKGINSPSTANPTFSDTAPMQFGRLHYAPPERYFDGSVDDAYFDNTKGWTAEEVYDKYYANPKAR